MLIKKSVLTKQIVYNVTDRRKNLPVVDENGFSTIRRLDLRDNTVNNEQELKQINNQIVQRVLEMTKDHNINHLLTTKTYSSFSEAINNLFEESLLDKDEFDEMLFKRWLQYDNTFYLLETVIKTNKLSSIKDIKEFVDKMSVDYVLQLILKDNNVLTTSEFLHQELGINFNIDIDTFFVRLANDAHFFDDEVKLYVQNQSELPQYILNELKNNIDFYINKMYIMSKERFL